MNFASWFSWNCCQVTQACVCLGTKSSVTKASLLFLRSSSCAETQSERWVLLSWYMPPDRCSGCGLWLLGVHAPLDGSIHLQKKCLLCLLQKFLFSWIRYTHVICVKLSISNHVLDVIFNHQSPPSGWLGPLSGQVTCLTHHILRQLMPPHDIPFHQTGFKIHVTSSWSALLFLREKKN